MEKGSGKPPQTCPIKLRSAPVHGFVGEIAPLPLIRCPFCHAGQVVWFVSGTTANPGRHFYKCENQGPGGCNFWKWENNYIEYLRSRWGKFFMPAPYLVLLDNNAWLRKIWIVAIAHCLALCVVIARIN
ncbi:uncharacterized protein LOC124694654 [Lolium rigidum]|uniref:uncharacterized protein LOC124694654 n=1 Tax=Lolium rigidum TaxID=89674 RepID=UPI001F5D6E09|nr:uncharacterized protein LOC124694654 [Lolium rigidum]